MIPGLLLATLVSGVSNGLSFDGLFVLIAGRAEESLKTHCRLYLSHLSDTPDSTVFLLP